MSDEDEAPYDVGEVVWVKLGNRWWPGEVYPESQVPKEVLGSNKKSPIAIVKFFHEDTYELVKNVNNICRYNCPNKTEFIRKGLELYRANNNKYMNKFPTDIQTAEEVTGGDVNILTRAEFAPSKKLNYSTIFGNQSKKTKKNVKSAQNKSNEQQQSSRGRRKKSHQANETPVIVRSPAFSAKNLDKIHESRILPQKTIQTSPNATPGTYKCHLCDFTSTRQNVIVLHAKSHTTSTPLISNKPKEPKSILKKKPACRVEPIVIDDSDSGEEQQRSTEADKSIEKTIDDDVGEKIEHQINNSRNRSKTRQSGILKSIPTATKTSRTSRLSPQDVSNSSDEVGLVIELDDTTTTSNSTLPEKKKTDIENEIRSKLLADWNDDDEEDDNDSKSNDRETVSAQNQKQYDEEGKNLVQAPTRLEVPTRLSTDHFLQETSSRYENDELTELIKQSNLSNSSSSSSIQTIQNQCSSTPKYRNIPKKDRRDVVLKDFDNSSAENSNSRSSANGLINSENQIEKSQNTSENLKESEKILENSEIKSNENDVFRKSMDNDETEKMTVESEKTEKLSCNSSEVLDTTKNTGNETIPDEFQSEPEHRQEVEKDNDPELNSEKSPAENKVINKEVEENSEADKAKKDENIEEEVKKTEKNLLSENDDKKPLSVKKGRFSFEKQKEISQKRQQQSPKPLISCFDFREDEEEGDFLTSLSKLKKKYLSPEKNFSDVPPSNDVKDEAKIEESQIQERIEIERKDKQLSDDIETLLNSTQLPDFVNDHTVKLTTNLSSPSIASTSITHEVRTLPPKERGKRIFKSRNRSKFEEPPLPSTSSSPSCLLNISSPNTLQSNENTDEKEDKSKKSNLETNEISKEITSKVNDSAEKLLHHQQNVEGKLILNELCSIDEQGAKESLTENSTDKPPVVVTNSNELDIKHIENVPLEKIKEDVLNKQHVQENDETIENSEKDDDSSVYRKSLENLAENIVSNEPTNELQISNKKEDENTEESATNTTSFSESQEMMDSNYRNELAVAEMLISIPSKLMNDEIEMKKSEKLHQQKDENSFIDCKEDSKSKKEIELITSTNETSLIEEKTLSLLKPNTQTENLAEIEKVKSQTTLSLPSQQQRKRRAHMKITPRKRIIQTPVSSFLVATQSLSQKATSDSEIVDNNQQTIIPPLKDTITTSINTEKQLVPDATTRQSIESPRKSLECKYQDSTNDSLKTLKQITDEKMVQSYESDKLVTDNFVKKYIKDAMIDDDNLQINQEEKEKNALIKLKPQDSTTKVDTNDKEKVEIKKSLDVSPASKKSTNELSDSKMKLTSKQVTEILDLRSMGMRADTPKNEIDDNVHSSAKTSKSALNLDSTIKKHNIEEIKDKLNKKEVNDKVSEINETIKQTQISNESKSSSETNKPKCSIAISPVTNTSVDGQKRRSSRELMNLLQYVCVTADKSSDAEVKEVLRNAPDKFDDIKDDKITNVRSFRPRKAKENIDVRIRASLSPPNESIGTQKSPTSANNSGLYLELIQAQKSTSLKDVIKNSKMISDQQRLSKEEENVETLVDVNKPHQSQQIRQSQDIIPQKSVDSSHVIPTSVTVTVTVESVKVSKNTVKVDDVQNQHLYPIQQQSSKQLTNKAQDDIASNSTVGVKKDEREKLNQSKIPANIGIKENVQTITRKEVRKSQEQEIKKQLTTTAIATNVNQRRVSISTTKIQPEMHEKIILTKATTIDQGINQLLGQHKISNITENKHEITARVPKKRKPAFDDIEDIPSFVIQKKALIDSSEEQQSQPSQKQQKQQKQQQKQLYQVQQQQQQQQQQQIQIKQQSQFIQQKKSDLNMKMKEQRQQHHQPSQTIISRIVDETAFDISNMPILLTNNESNILHGDTNMGQVHFVITTPQSTSTLPTTIAAIISESLPLTATATATMTTTTTTTTTTSTTTVVMPSSNKTTVAKKKITKQSSTNNQIIQECISKQNAKASSNVLIQNESKEIGTDGKGNKFVIVRSENGAKMIIQPSSLPTLQRKTQSPISQLQSVNTQQQKPKQQQHHQQTGGKNISYDKSNVISSQIISSSAGKHILNKTVSSPPIPIPIGADSNFVITSKGNVYSSQNKLSGNINSNKNTDSRGSQTSVAVTQICNISSSTSSASSLTRRLSRQGTTLQPLVGERFSRQQIIVEEPAKVIIQQKNMVEEICNSSSSHVVQQEPGEISASEAAELTTRFGFIEVQQVQSPPSPAETIKSKSEVAMSKFNVTEVPPLAALSDGQLLQQQMSQPQQQQTSRTPAKRKNVSLSQSGQQNSQTTNKSTKPVQAVQAVQAVQTVQLSGNTSTSTSFPSQERITENMSQLLAIPGESFGGPPGSFFLCSSENDNYTPINNIPLFLDGNNQLIPIENETGTILDEEFNTQVVVQTNEEENGQILTDMSQLEDNGNQYVLSTDDGSLIFDAQNILALAANSGHGSDVAQLISIEGQQFLLTPDTLAAISQSDDLSGPILLSETIDGQFTTSNPDILAAALAGTEVYNQEQLLQMENGSVLQIETTNGVVKQIVKQGIAFQPINPPVTAQTSETNAILTQPPIMSTLEVPSSKKKAKLDPIVVTKTNKSGLIGQNLDDSLAVIGVTTQSSAVPSSLNLPITVTNPAIAPKTTSNSLTLGGIYPSSLGQGSQISPTLSSMNNDQELVAAGYELFTTSAIDSQTGIDDCGREGTSGNVNKSRVTKSGEIILQHASTEQEQSQQNEGEEIVMVDFSNTDANNVHHHSNEFIVHSEQSQHQISSGNFDNSVTTR